ncbi:hypothetical protein O3P69_004963 [Scylla paramamosain]|uniref:Uncharacterized protein n=1 Tax=Scylla paramamosain TaxID=85552 RepID=A0AAW0UA61_SCYPA
MYPSMAMTQRKLAEWEELKCAAVSAQIFPLLCAGFHGRDLVLLPIVDTRYALCYIGEGTSERDLGPLEESFLVYHSITCNSW